MEISNHSSESIYQTSERTPTWPRYRVYISRGFQNLYIESGSNIRRHRNKNIAKQTTCSKPSKRQIKECVWKTAKFWTECCTTERSGRIVFLHAESGDLDWCLWLRSDAYCNWSQTWANLSLQLFSILVGEERHMIQSTCSGGSQRHRAGKWCREIWIRSRGGRPVIQD